MRIERDASNSFTLAARPTLSPSRWLLRFNLVEDVSVEQLCIATAYAQTGQPVLLTFTEVDASPDPQAAEVTLPPGQWRLRVYEQSTTSLNYANSDRLVYDVLVEVVGADAEPPPPTDPCEGGGGGPCPTTTVNGEESDTPTITVMQGGVEVGTLNPATGVHTVPECDTLCDQLADPLLDVRDAVDCIPDGNIPEWALVMLDQPEATPEVIAVSISNAGKTDDVRDIICEPCDPVTIKDQDDNTIDSVPAGGEYQVIVVSGIDGGLSNTTYTNSIIQP